jgi:hypothetical protein
VKSRFLASLEMTKGDFKEDKWKRLETPTQRSGFAFARLHAGLSSGRAYGAWIIAT